MNILIPLWFWLMDNFHFISQKVEQFLDYYFEEVSYEEI